MGENKPYFSIFPLQTEANSSDLLSRPPGLAVMEALACSLPPSQVLWSCGWQEFMAKARAAMFFPNLFILFFPHGCSPHTSVELGEAEVVFLSISISQEESGDDRGVSGPPSFFNPRNTVCDIPRIHAPVSAQPAPAYTQAAQASHSG